MLDIMNVVCSLKTANQLVYLTRKTKLELNIFRGLLKKFGTRPLFL